MKLESTTGNLVEMAKDGVFDAIVHCQNCFHGWEKGIVVAIGKAFPEAIAADLKTIKGDKSKLGTYSFAKVTLGNGKTLYVINLYAQYSYGQGKHLIDNFFAEGLRKINTDFAGLKIGYPLIGSGQAGGNWSEIEPIIDTSLKDVNHQLVVFNQ